MPKINVFAWVVAALVCAAVILGAGVLVKSCGDQAAADRAAVAEFRRVYLMQTQAIDTALVVVGDLDNERATNPNVRLDKGWLGNAKDAGRLIALSVGNLRGVRLPAGREDTQTRIDEMLSYYADGARLLAAIAENHDPALLGDAIAKFDLAGAYRDGIAGDLTGR